MKIVTGHQPVYLPWLGLIHKASLSDVFIYMDDVQYLVRDWNNRNLVKTAQGKPIWLTVPVDLKHSPSHTLKDILIASDHGPLHKTWHYKHWMTLKTLYARAPYFKDYAPFFEWLYLEKKWERLDDLNLTLLKKIFEWFRLDTQIVVASEVGFTGVKSDLVLEHGVRYNADIVLTGMYGKDYIDVQKFENRGIKVVFQDYNHPIYEQRVPGEFFHLSFVDLLFIYGPQSRDICFSNNITREDLCRMTAV